MKPHVKTGLKLRNWAGIKRVFLTVLSSFVRHRFYTFGQEREDQAALRGDNGHASHHPFHCPTVKNGVNSQFGINRG